MFKKKHIFKNYIRGRVFRLKWVAADRKNLLNLSVFLPEAEVTIFALFRSEKCNKIVHNFYNTKGRFSLEKKLETVDKFTCHSSWTLKKKKQLWSNWNGCFFEPFKFFFLAICCMWIIPEVISQAKSSYFLLGRIQGIFIKETSDTMLKF